MARGKISGGKKKRGKVPVPRRRRKVTKTRKHASIRRLTAELLRREREGNVEDARAKADVGGILLTVREQIDHGEWTAWLEEDVPYDPRTAQRAIELHRWAQEHPRLFKRLSPLGLSKVRLLSKLPLSRVTALSKAKDVEIPGAGLRLPLDQLTVAQLAHVLGDVEARSLDEELERRRRIDRMSRGVQRIATRATDMEIEGVPRETAKRWHHTLLAAAAQIAQRFELE